MLDANTSVQIKQKRSLNVAFVYILAVVLIGFGEREEIVECFSELAELTVRTSNPNPNKPVFKEYQIDNKNVPFSEWRNPYLYFKTAYVTEQDIVDMPTKYRVSLEQDTVEKATDSG